MIQNGESDEVFIQNSPSIFNFVFVAVPFSLHLKNLPLKGAAPGGRAIREQGGERICRDDSQ
jgi:hypothetical protein